LVCTCVQGRCSIVQYSLFHYTHRHLGYGHIHPIALQYYYFTGKTTRDQQDDIRSSCITKWWGWWPVRWYSRKWGTYVVMVMMRINKVCVSSQGDGHSMAAVIKTYCTSRGVPSQ